MNKSNVTNLIALFLTLVGYFLQNEQIYTIGIFALSGAITNTLAIHMLFEKVPFLYGSGVVESRFFEFKKAISELMMNQFFTKENICKFFEEEFSSSKSHLNFDLVLEKVDFSKAYESLKKTVLESPFGGMLSMFGGEVALEPLKEPFIEKLKISIIEISKEKNFKKAINDSLNSKNISDDIYEKIKLLVDKRLDELTPKLVKNIVQDMIRKHLGWLVVWGGVFGGLIGFVSNLV